MRGECPPVMKRADNETDAAAAKGRHPWRENIEALAMAIVVALLFKSFILEISKIPSGSMQPTLMGNPETQVFDRVLVDKLSFQMRDPKRWEIVVFKHPLENSRIMVKRLVGMPGEEIRIAGGDLWTRANDGEDWQILRRPEAVQEEMWRTLEPDEPARTSWKRAEGTRGWQIQGRDVMADGPGRVHYRDPNGAIRDVYVDGYPDVLRPKIGVRPEWGRNHVGDVRLTAQIEAEAQTGEVVVELREGDLRYAFVLPGPAAELDAPTLRVVEGDAVRNVSAQDPWRLPAGRSVEVRVQNLDDRLSFEVDGDEVASLEIAPFRGKGTGIDLIVREGSASFEDVVVERDIYYLAHRGSTWQTKIPEGQYVMLGDNTQDSADSRDWEVVRFEWEDPQAGPQSVRGNFRGNNENPTRNAAIGQTRFRDEWGEEHWFATTDGRQGLQASSPLVARELIQGRALAVFWPLKPHKGIWRLAWLH